MASIGTRVTWTRTISCGASSACIWRTASRKGILSISPTVPPTSTRQISAFWPPLISSCAARMMRCLISSVMWGMIWTVAPEKSPRRSLSMTRR